MEFVLKWIVSILIGFTILKLLSLWVQLRTAKLARFARNQGYDFEEGEGIRPMLVWHNNLKFLELHREWGNDPYRDEIRKEGNKLYIKLANKPLVRKYADFTSFPFGRGTRLNVFYLIQGNYKGLDFRAFMYDFTSRQDGCGWSGTYSIVMIPAKHAPRAFLPKNVFYEKGMLCHYRRNWLTGKRIHKRIMLLKSLL